MATADTHLLPDRRHLRLHGLSGRRRADHADDVLSDLFGTIVNALRPTFRLSRIEGDAAFMFATMESIDGSMLLDTIEHCYFGFRRRRRDVRQATSCECNACSRIPGPRPQVRRPPRPRAHPAIAGRGELLGMDAIVIHRILKNDVIKNLAVNAYALITQKCIDASDLDPVALGMSPHSETYDSIGEVPGWVHDLERRWQEEEDRKRVRVSVDDAVLSLSVPTTAPPQVAWEFLTTPGQRMTWQPWVTEVTVKGKPGGRRGVGSANHCMHGKEAVIEEILDWRPYDYVTDRTILDTPGGPVKLLHTVELEPESRRHDDPLPFRSARIEPGDRGDGEIGPAYEQASAHPALPGLTAQLAEAAATPARPIPSQSLQWPRPGISAD